MDERVHYAETEYGFEYGAARVERTASHKGTVVIGILDRITGKRLVDLYVSPQGRSVRVSRPLLRGKKP